MAYDHLAIEARWQRYWEEHGTFRATRRSGRPKRYVLDMFPYPSGVGLHVGHPEGYTATDIMARAWRLRGPSLRGGSAGALRLRHPPHPVAEPVASVGHVEPGRHAARE